MLSLPLDTRSPFDNKTSQHIYTTYVKGVVGVGWGNRVVQVTEDIRHLTNVSRFAKWSFLLHINCIFTQNVYKTNHDKTIFTFDYWSISHIRVTKIARTIDDQN